MKTVLHVITIKLEKKSLHRIETRLSVSAALEIAELNIGAVC